MIEISFYSMKNRQKIYQNQSFVVEIFIQLKVIL